MSEFLEQKFPRNLWTPDNHTSLAVETARRNMNNTSYEILLDNLQKLVETDVSNGISFAILNSSDLKENPQSLSKRVKYSKDEAIVLFNPFANALTPNALVKAEFIRQVAQNLGITDDRGDFKPLIVIASPGFRGSNVYFTSDQRQRLKDGDFEPFVSKALGTIKQRGFGRVSLLGFSQGADMALAAAIFASESHIDAQGLAIGDPVSVEDRKVRGLLLDFNKAGKRSLDSAVEETKLDAQKRALGTVDYTRFGFSAMFPNNWLFVQGMTHDTALERLIAARSVPTLGNMAVGYAENSAITKPNEIERTLGSEALARYILGIDHFMVMGADHTWGDRLSIYASLLKYFVDEYGKSKTYNLL